MAHSLSTRTVLRGTLLVTLLGAGVAGFLSVATFNQPSADTLATPTVTLRAVPTSATGTTPIMLTLTNSGTTPISLPSAAPYMVWQGSNPIYAPTLDASTVSVAAGGTRQWTWNEQNDDGDHVSAGSYTITVPYEQGGTARSTQVTVTIAP